MVIELTKRKNQSEAKKKKEIKEKENELREKEEELKQKERKKDIQEKENELKEREEKLKQKAKDNKTATVKAKWVAAQLQLMAGQLDHLANHILTEIMNE